MKEQKQNITDFFGRILFLILFFLLISVYADKPVTQVNHTLRTELFSDSQSISRTADLPVVSVTSFQKAWIFVIDRMHPRFADTSFKVVASNHSIAQKYISIQKKQLLIKPKHLYQLYYLLFAEDSGDYPILS
jgi:hypothetical protein